MAGRVVERHKPTTPIRAVFIGADVQLAGEIVDISLTGVLVRCPSDLRPGTVGKLGFELGHDTFRASASVRRVVPGVGLAFKFLNMTPIDRQALHKLVMRLSLGK